jgi:hypothetical protein
MENEMKTRYDNTRSRQAKKRTCNRKAQRSVKFAARAVETQRGRAA